VLADFVRERSQSEDYRRHLGLPAVIRRDFEHISTMVTQENRALAEMTDLEKERTSANVRINRIVLYIDDLDHCPEKLVVEVLSAVHLQLAFPDLTNSNRALLLTLTRSITSRNWSPYMVGERQAYKGRSFLKTIIQ
jgi:hypothetical protein